MLFFLTAEVEYLVEFIPNKSRPFAPIAQWIERLASDQKVVGSTPTGRDLFWRPVG